ncbi:MAG: LuxR C-terminal-related transcriptional regulator [Woeseiaceae bacterium]|nr:LuxR C-terminal-related transcriptional regulator [Woeseiaceae bacterium]
MFVRLGRGLRANDVAAELHVSPKTVHTYRSRIFEKTGLKSDAEIVHYAVRNGLLD